MTTQTQQDSQTIIVAGEAQFPALRGGAAPLSVSGSGAPIYDDRTGHLNLALPHADNELEDDVYRLRSALSALDADAQKQDAVLAGEQQARETADTALACRIDEEGRTRDQGDAALQELLQKTMQEALQEEALARGQGDGSLEKALQAEAAARAAALSDHASKCSGAMDDLRLLVEQLAVKASQKYDIGQFEDFPFALPRPGWMVRNGVWLAKADVEYPELWAYLHDTEEGRSRCVPLPTWESMSVAAGGVGGVIWFSVDDVNKRIKLPDTRGDYSRCAGSSYLQAVGQWHQDVMKAHNHTATTCTPQQGGGAYFGSALGNGPWGSGTTSTVGGSETCPRTYAVLGCVYVRRI